MAPKDPVLFIWQQHWPGTTKKEFRLLVFTAGTYKTQMTKPFRTMCRRSYCVLQSVITSYSIHYTKLYDIVRQLEFTFPVCHPDTQP